MKRLRTLPKLVLASAGAAALLGCGGGGSNVSSIKGYPDFVVIGDEYYTVDGGPYPVVNGVPYNRTVPSSPTESSAEKPAAQP